MDILSELAVKHQTDKGPSHHCFTRFYAKLFQDKRESIQNVLEIGIAWGSSLLMWKDYFPKATIYGIDISIPERVKGQDRITCGIADQENVPQLTRLLEEWNKPQFDMILDDGGHFVSQQRITFETCWNYLVPGGVYIIEDLHTNILDNYPNRIPSFINEYTTVHKHLLKMMTHGTTELKIPMKEVGDILYFSNTETKSLTCAIYKKGM